MLKTKNGWIMWDGEEGGTMVRVDSIVAVDFGHHTDKGAWLVIYIGHDEFFSFKGDCAKMLQEWLWWRFSGAVCNDLDLP